MSEKEDAVANGAPSLEQLGGKSPPEKWAYIFHLLLAGVVAIIGSAIWTERDASPEAMGATMFLLLVLFALPGLCLLVGAFIYSFKAAEEWPLHVLLGLIVLTLVAMMIRTEQSTLIFVILDAIYVLGAILSAIFWFSKNRKKKPAT